MTSLIRNGLLVTDLFTDGSGLASLPTGVALIVSLDQWQKHRDTLLAGGQSLGLRLRSGQPPRLVAGDLQYFALIALEFPRFPDGRAYTHARMLRERFHFAGEVRAVGDVLQEQLHFMQRCGFDAF